MDKAQIEKIVDESFDQALAGIDKQLEIELHPDAFANEHSWLRVKNAIKINNKALRLAVKKSLSSILK